MEPNSESGAKGDDPYSATATTPFGRFARSVVGSGGWWPLEFAGLIVALALLLALNDRIDIIWTPAPLWAAVASLIAVALLVRRVPVWITVSWLLGLSTYVWSLAPGATLLASLWGLVFVASAAAGRWSTAMLFAVVYIFSNDLQNALALNAFDLQTYTSGSVHYRLGAVALVLFAPAVAGFARARSRWLASAWWVLASVSAYGAVISGSRGVYVPFLLILGLTALRVFKRGRTPWRWVLGLVALFAVLVVTDVVVPFHPAAEALSAKATLDAQATAAASSGGFTQRLRFWDQGLSMAWQHPSGVGLGAFRDTIHAFQRFPMVWSSSPHNIFVETVATVGVPGLTVLLILLGHAFVVGWQSRRWPWALAMLGIWSTLAVDVTADYPSMMAVAFATVGACLGPSATRFAPPVATAWRSARLRTLGVWLASLTVALGAALTVWWFSPCEGSMCALTQGRGVETRSWLPSQDCRWNSIPRSFGNWSASIQIASGSFSWN